MRPKILRYVFVAILCALVPMVIAPVAGMPPGVTALTRDSAEVPLLALAPPPLDKRVPVLTHDPSTPAPLRIGELIDVHITPANAGRWDVLADGSARWRLALTSPGAVTVSLGFTRFRLPQGAVLTVRNAGGAEQVGPFRAADNQAHGQLWTPLVTGELVQLELVLPVAERDALELELTKFAYGILDPFNMPRDKSGSCNVDVVCPEGNAWRDQIQSVALIVINGTALCSGALVNNTSQNQRPFFLTAYHCGINLFNAASVVSYWNYQNSTCRAPNSAASGQPGDGSKAQALVGGAMLQAENPASDMTLIEFNQAVPASYKPAWAGWDRSGAAPPSAVGIHHPLGDEKRISFENQPTRITSYGGSNSPGAATHLRVIDWDLGTTEPGSSGSPLFDQNKRIVGQLHGGLAACGNNDSDWYGRFSVSWVQGGLAGLLDPLNTGAVTLDTLAGLSFTSGVPLSPLTPRPYRHVFTTTRPATFAITSGVLPGGLSLNGVTGVLSGIPPAV
ncbi:MAG TPA: Ig domain-containing protein, partial [Roseiflexaceae bacterium]|nr:Ig domain-containing protein [Roseiflexaceae bacterium]